MRRNQGFTLFEVLIALGIFGMVVIGMMMALDSTLAAAKEARQEQAVRTQIANRMALLEGEELKELERRIQIESPKMTFIETVQKEAAQGRDREVLDGFWRVTILAKWQVGGQAVQEQASFLRYQP